MKNNNLVPMDRSHRILQKVRRYLTELDVFYADADRSVSVLLDALPHADDRLLLEMLPLLADSGGDRVLWPFFDLMMQTSLEDPIRTTIAIQLAAVASQSDDVEVIRLKLIEKLQHPDAVIRSCCALALGWEGNWMATDELTALLDDADREVQTAAICALASLDDERILDLLEVRLKTGPLDARSVIFLNLWRFQRQLPRVEKLYLNAVVDVDVNLRLDILAGLALIPISSSLLNCYDKLLSDHEAQIRCQVLDNLLQLNPSAYRSLIPRLRILLNDEDTCVRQAAVRLFVISH